ncbi:hypothetical protein K9M59_01270 [Candidatus Gracilibacteria bacterium]|nr:hypothetical protein [Candidatus Gracilibacteria bacterium]MCF7819198.1 hypothetical protein [Candidatus Gracilibacteria bacterium]
MDIRSKEQGFSILEILITIGIVVSIAAIGIPGLIRVFSANNFREESREIVNIMNEARTNAIASIKCFHEESLKEWIFELDSSSRKMMLKCASQSNPLTLLETYSQDIGDYIVIDTLELADGTPVENIQIHFAAETAQAKINNGAQKSFRMVFSAPLSGDQKTLCFHSVAGFPTLNDEALSFPCP